MATASDGLLLVEFGGAPSSGYEELTDAGDRKTFHAGATPGSVLWSGANDRDVDIVIDGAISGSLMTQGSGNDTVNISAGQYNLGGNKDQQIAGSTGVSISRASTDTHLVSSVTINGAGAYVVVAGANGTAFSSERGAAGGPPEIPAGSIEVGQVQLSSDTAAPIVDAEILAIPGLTRETPNYPIYDPAAVYESGGVTFSQPLPADHASGGTKGVYARYYVPVFSEVALGKDFSPPSESVTTNSDQRYGAVVASISRSLSAGSVNIALNDGHTDPILSAENDRRWCKFHSNRYRTPHIRGQAYFSVTVNYSASDTISADLSMAPDRAWKQQSS